MRFLIVGGGAMGKRRTRCLLANKVAAGDIHLVDMRADRRDQVTKKYSVETFDNLDAGLKWGRMPSSCRSQALTTWMSALPRHGRRSTCSAKCRCLRISMASMN